MTFSAMLTCSSLLAFVSFGFQGAMKCSPMDHCDPCRITGGDKRDRTADPLLARQVLSQLSYTPAYI